MAHNIIDPKNIAIQGRWVPRSSNTTALSRRRNTSIAGQGVFKVGRKRRERADAGEDCRVLLLC